MPSLGSLGSCFVLPTDVISNPKSADPEQWELGVPLSIRSPVWRAELQEMGALGQQWQHRAVDSLCGCTRPWTHGKASLINVGFLLALFDGTRLRHSISVSLCRAMCIRESSISHVLTPE